MKKTSGVSRGSLRVNVNEDIFLGYEMAATGLTIGYTEFLFYGKGRDAEFNAASVFLKKLAQVFSAGGWPVVKESPGPEAPGAGRPLNTEFFMFIFTKNRPSRTALWDGV